MWGNLLGEIRFGTIRVMKVIFLNTWHGEMQSELHTYINKHLHDTDVFCFQESRSQDRVAYEELLAPDFEIHVAQRQEPDGSWFSNVTYVRKSIPIIEKSSLFTTSVDGLSVGIAAVLTLQLDDVELTICNVHGVSQPGHKLDTPARLYQSKEIIEAFKDKEAVIIGGDFNLLPQAQSIQTFTQHGYRNLISEFDIKTTRNHITYDLYPDNIQYYADYAFVSPAVQVANFTIPSDVVSDHQPLELRFDCVALPLLQPASPQSEFALA